MSGGVARLCSSACIAASRWSPACTTGAGKTAIECNTQCIPRCVWIPLILLKTENNKKIISGYCSHQKTLFICLDTLFISHEQCTGTGKKKGAETQNIQMWMWSKRSLYQRQNRVASLSNEDLEDLLESIPYHDQIIHSIQGMMPSGLMVTDGCTRVIAR